MRIVLKTIILNLLWAYPTFGKHCEYGTAPGRWIPNESKPDWLTWQILDKGCILKDLAAPIIEAASNERVGAEVQRNTSGSQNKIGILLLGDSAERILVRHICEEWVGGPVELFDIRLDEDEEGDRSCNRDLAPNCCTCDIPGLHITREAIWSVMSRWLPNGHHEGRKGSAKERTTKGLKLFQQQYGRMPDLVLVQSAFWELAALWNQQGSMENQITNERALPQFYIEEYMTEASNLVSHLQVLLNNSNTLLVWKTTPYPRLNPSQPGRFEAYYLGQKSHLAELNAAGRIMAKKMGIPIIDQAYMVESFSSPEEYTFDDHHVKDWVSYAHLNIMLSMISQERRKQHRVADAKVTIQARSGIRTAKADHAGLIN